MGICRGVRYGDLGLVLVSQHGTPPFLIVNWLTTFFGLASLAAFMASCNFARGISPVSVTCPSDTLAVTPFTLYFARPASTALFIFGSSETTIGGLTLRLLTTDLTLATP